MTAFSSVRRKLAGANDRKFPWGAPTWPQSVGRPAPERKVGVDYPTDWARRYPARLLRAMLLDNLARPLTHAVASPEVRGDEVLELVDQPVVFAVNHSSHADTLVLLSVLPARFRHNTVVAAAADHFFDRRWKAHLWALTLALFPIERHRVNRRSADLASELLEDGWNLLIYPEGGRSHDGWFGEFKGGAAYLAQRTGRPVVPVHLEGTFKILSRGQKRLRRHPTRVTFGSPLSPKADEPARRFSAHIEQAVEVLADEATSDFWSARRRAASGDTPAARGPDASPWRRAWELDQARRDDNDRSRELRWAVRERTSRARRKGIAGGAPRP